MKQLILSILLTCAIAMTATAAVGDRHIEQAGAFSFQAPAGWQFREFPGMKYQIALGAPNNGFSPNINVIDEAYQGSLQSYADANIDVLKKMFTGFVLVKRYSFATKAGVKGEVVVINSEQYHNLLRQTFYILQGTNGKFFVITCSALKDGGEKFDSAFEESVKTFEITK